MKLLVRAIAMACVWLLLTIPTQAFAQQITLSMAGLVDYGRDDLYLFFDNDGEIAFLGGEAYTLSLTLDAADLALVQSSPTFADYAGASVALTGALTINGKSLIWTDEQAYAAVDLELAQENPPSDERQAIAMRTTASGQINTGDLHIAANHTVYAFFWPLLASTALNQEIKFPDNPFDMIASSAFVATGMGPSQIETTWFEAKASSATWTISAVPEPGQYGMLAAGLMAMMLALRRRYSTVTDFARLRGLSTIHWYVAQCRKFSQWGQSHRATRNMGQIVIWR